MKPVVDGLEKELPGQLIIIRVNVQESVGRELASVYKFQYTPTFIFFGANGVELWRQIGGLDVEHLRASLKLP